MKRYKPVTSLVNGEVIKDLLDICNEWFVNPFIQPYAGANYECRYCGATRGKDGAAHHSASDCPVQKYLDVVEKHKRWIVEVNPGTPGKG